MNLSSIYQEIDKQNNYLQQYFPPISLTYLEYPDQEYQKYNLLKKYHGHHFTNVIMPFKNNQSTIDIIKMQSKLYHHPKIMIKKRYQRDQNVKKLVENIILQNDQYAQMHQHIKQEEHKTYYNIPDPELAMTYYSVKGKK